MRTTIQPNQTRTEFDVVEYADDLFAVQIGERHPGDLADHAGTRVNVILTDSDWQKVVDLLAEHGVTARAAASMPF